MRKQGIKKISAEDFDAQFESGDVLEHLDLKSAKVVRKIQRVNIDFPVLMLGRLDREAARNGVPRAALIKMWLADRLQKV